MHDKGIEGKTMLLIVAVQSRTFSISGQKLVRMVSPKGIEAMTEEVDDCIANGLDSSDCFGHLMTSPLYNQLVDTIDPQRASRAFKEVDGAPTCPMRLRKREEEEESELERLTKENKVLKKSLFSSNAYIVAAVVLFTFHEFAIDSIDYFQSRKLNVFITIALFSLLMAFRGPIIRCFATALSLLLLKFLDYSFKRRLAAAQQNSERSADASPSIVVTVVPGDSMDEVARDPLP